MRRHEAAFNRVVEVVQNQHEIARKKMENQHVLMVGDASAAVRDLWNRSRGPLALQDNPPTAGYNPLTLRALAFSTAQALAFSTAVHSDPVRP